MTINKNRVFQIGDRGYSVLHGHVTAVRIGSLENIGRKDRIVWELHEWTCGPDTFSTLLNGYRHEIDKLPLVISVPEAKKAGLPISTEKHTLEATVKVNGLSVGPEAGIIVTGINGSLRKILGKEGHLKFTWVDEIK